MPKHSDSDSDIDSDSDSDSDLTTAAAATTSQWTAQWHAWRLKRVHNTKSATL